MKQLSSLLLLTVMFLQGFAQSKINTKIQIPELKGLKKAEKLKNLKSNDMVCDSATSFKFTNGNWDKIAAEYVEFDCDKSILYAYYIAKDDNGTMINYRQNRYKDANGNDTLLIVEKMDGGNWVFSEKIKTVYNGNKDLLVQTLYVYESGAWRFESKDSLVYNENNKQTSYFQYVYSQYSQDNIYLVYTETHTYSGDVITQIDIDKEGTLLKYTNIVWYDQSKFLFTELVYWWKNNVKYYKAIYTYDASSNLTKTDYYLADENGTIESTSYNRDVYVYDAKNNLTKYVFEKYDSDAWYETDKTTYSYTYDSNNNITEQIEEVYESDENNSNLALTSKSKEVNHRYLNVAPFTLTTSLDQEVQSGTEIELTASGANKYEWSTGATTSSITVSPTASTVYTVTGKISGCKSTASIAITMTGINVEKSLTNNVKIYPNPVVDNVNINISNLNNENTVIEIRNNTGAIIYTNNSNDASINNAVSLEKLNSGIYFINIIQGNNKYTERIIKK